MGGFFGVASKESCTFDLFFGVDYHSHLGTRRAGMAVYGDGKFRKSIHSIEESSLRAKFEHELDELEGKFGIGCISDFEAQPILVRSHHGTFAITTVSKINNANEIVEKILENRTHFFEMSNGEINPTELVAAIINQKDNLIEGIKYALEIIEGSVSMLILTPKGIYAARDKLGRTPVIIGKKEGAYCAAFESYSFQKLEYSLVRELGPGEVVVFDADSIKTLVKPGDKMKICTFLWVYYGYPAATYEGVNVEVMRYNCGRYLAKRDNVEVDVVAGVPDSGTPHAIGYANEAGIPFSRPFIKYTPTWPRSFTPSNQAMRNLVAKMKLIPNRAMLEGKRLLFCDDSIVRGTQLNDNVRVLYDYGAREVHMRIACPPLIYSCPFVGFTASKSDMELITRRIIKDFEGDANKNLESYATTDSPEYKRLVEAIRSRFGLTSLRFNTIETLIRSIGLPKCKVCTHCFDGSSHF